MASSVSSLNNYSNFPLFNFGDMNLLASGMAAMQGRVDQNKANLQNLGTQLSTQFLDNITRDSDKVYFQERLNEALNLVETYANSADLSDNNVAGKLSSKLKEVVDDRVVDAIASTTQRRLETAHIQDLKKNDPEKYSDVNFSVYNKAWENYVNNDDPYSTYNGATYHNYVDNFKRLTSKESLKMFEDMGINGEWVQREDGNVYYDFKNKYAGTQDINRLQQAVQQIIGADGVRQMQINAEYAYGDYNNPLVVESLREEYNNYHNDINSSLVSDKEALEKAIKGASNQDKKQAYQEQLDEINRKIENTSNRNFDTDVATNGVLDPSKYKNIYTNYQTNKEMQSLTGLMYQKPRLIESDVEDIRLDVLKFERDNFESDRDYELKVQKHEAEMKAKGLDVNGNPLQTNGNGAITMLNSDLTPGASKELDEDKIGENDTYTLARDEQNKAIQGVNNLVDGAMSKASTIELVNELTGVDIATLKEVKIAGRMVKIDDSNRGEVLSALNRFKAVMMDGGSVVRETRKAMSSVTDNIINDAVTHYRDNQKDQSGLFLNNDNFYFEKTQNGQYEYKVGKFSSTGGKSNYQYLMDKASKNGVNSLNEAEKATLRTYVAKGVILDKGFQMNDWERQQMYASLQEDVHSMLKSSKAVNTMPSYSNLSRSTLSSKGTRVYSGNTIGKQGDYRQYTEISPEQARARRESGQTFHRVESGNLKGTYWIPETELPTYTSNQDQQYSKIGWGDGWNLSKSVNDKLKDVRNITKNATSDMFKSTDIGTLNIPAKSTTGESLTKYIGVPIPEKAIINIEPEIVNNKETGNYFMKYSLTDTKGVSTTVDVKTNDGKPVILTKKELGNNVAPSVNSIYNSSYGRRAGEISLGTSATIKNKNVIGSVENDLPSDYFEKSIESLKSSLSNSPQALQYINEQANRFRNGEFSFKISSGGEEGATYKVYMTDSEGNSAPIFDTGLTMLDENTVIKPYLQNRKTGIEDLFIDNFLKRQLNIK